MARRRSRKTAKIEPSVQTFRFILEGTGNDVIDLSQCASMLNRRFYRQGLNWAVAGFTLQCYQGVNAYVNLSKLPNTWVTSNAWEKGFHVWRRMIKNATDESGAESVEGRYNDFKVFMDYDHYNGNTEMTDNLIPYDAHDPAHAWHGAPWSPSKVTIPDSAGGFVDYKLQMLGENDPSGAPVKSLIQGYADSRALPQPDDPHRPGDASDNWYLDVFDDGTVQDAQVVDNIGTPNDNPPYPLEGGYSGTSPPGTWSDTQYPGGESNPDGFGGREMHYMMGIRTTAVSSSTSAPGTNVPCGLIAVQSGVTLDDPNSGIDPVANLFVHLVPGPHKGYLCERMQDM